MPKRSAKRNKTSVVPPRFDIETLREIAGDKVFLRGVAYHKDKQVELIAIEKNRISARVLGSEIYRTSLAGGGCDFSGECTCPAFSDRGFCKHLVATALTSSALDPNAVEAADNRFARIRDHLRAQSGDKLVAMIMELAERDAALLQDLELAATASTADDESVFARFKKAITEATATRGYIDYREARAWAQEVESVLDRVASLIDGGRAPTVWRLLDHFFARMDQALLSMDDSDGAGGGAYAKGCEIHLTACRKSKLDPVALARELFAREVESDWDFFHGASATYSDVLGKHGLAEYRRLAEEAWRKIEPVWEGKRRISDDDFSARYRLSAILESFAERDGDLDTRIAIRAKDLSSAYAYLGIAELCLNNGHKSDAVKWAEEGLWQFEDQPDERLVLFTADLYKGVSRDEDAKKLLWRTFERHPSAELYRRLKSGANTDKAAAQAIRDRAFAILRAQLASSKQEAPYRWSSRAELLLDLMVEEGLIGEAWAVVRTYGCSESTLGALAKASEQSHPAEALKVFENQVDRLVKLGGQGNYADACRLITRIRDIRKRLNESAEHAAYLADLMSQHKAKRNFMKLLQAQN